MQTRLTKVPALLALGLSVIGLLLVTEVIRPFHDLSRDGPLALVFWATGAVLGGVCLFLRGRSLVLSAVACALNIIPLAGALVLWWLLSHTNFAWH